MNLGNICETDNVDIVLKKSGNNLGNLIFLESAKKLIDDKICIFEDEIDILFFTCANWLHENSDLEPYYNIIIEKNVPCICIGLGVQSDSFDKVPILKEGTLKFLKEISKRTPYILVRGDYTKKICNYYGIDNVKIGGCPSIFLNGDICLGQKMEELYKKDIKKLCLNMDLNRQYNRTEIRKFDSYYSKYILQNEKYLMMIIKGEKVHETILKSLSNKFESEQKYLEYVNDKLIFFKNIDEWSSFIKKYDHAIGDRIHGNIICFQNEIPTLCITIDTRTKELCDTLCLPNISHEEFSSFNIESMKEIIFEGKKFDENRKKLANLYIDLFQKAGIKINNKLLNFIK